MSIFTDIQRHDDWTARDYFAYDAVSNSMLSRMVKDPMTTHEKMRVTESMKMGSAADEFILTPERFKQNWKVLRDIVAPSGKNQSEFCRLITAGCDPEEAAAEAYKRPPADPEALYRQFSSWIELQTSPHAIDENTMHALNRMKENVMNHVAASQLVRDGDKQVCFTGVHKDTGVKVKGMLDILDADLEMDLKTTSTPWEKINRWWLRDRSYHTQRAMYTELSGATSTGLIVVRTTGRHRCRVFDLTDRMMEENWVGTLDQRIREYAWRKENNYWAHAISYYTRDGWETL